MLKQGDEIRRYRQADLEAAQIAGGFDRFGAGRNFAKAVIIAIVDYMEADLIGDPRR